MSVGEAESPTCSNDDSCNVQRDAGSPFLFEPSKSAQEFFSLERIHEESKSDKFLSMALAFLACYPFLKLLKKLLLSLAASGTKVYLAEVKDKEDLEDVTDISEPALKKARKQRDLKRKERLVEKKNAQRNIAFVLLKHPASLHRSQHLVREEMRNAGLEVLEDNEGDIPAQKVKEWSSEVKEELVQLGVFTNLAELEACAVEGASCHYWSVSWGTEKFGGCWSTAVDTIFGSIGVSESSKTLRGKMALSWGTTLKDHPLPVDRGLSVSAGALLALRQRVLCLGVEPAEDIFGTNIVKFACVDGDALKKHWLCGSKDQHKMIAPTGCENAKAVLEAFQSLGSPLVWRRPGGTKCTAVSFGRVGSNAVIVPVGDVQPDLDSVASQQLRVAGCKLSEKLQCRLLLVPGGPDVVCDAVSWLKRKERFSEDALRAENLRPLDGETAPPEATGTKVMAQFGGVGDWQRGVVQKVHEKKYGKTFSVRFFDSKEDEEAFDREQKEKEERKEKDKLKEKEELSKEETKEAKEPKDAREGEEKEEEEEADVGPGVVLMSLHDVSSLLLQAATKAGTQIAACCILNLQTDALPKEVSLYQLAAPLQVHTVGSRLWSFVLAWKLRWKLRNARMAVKTLRAGPSSVLEKLSLLVWGEPDDSDYIPPHLLLRDPIVSQRRLRVESHRCSEMATIAETDDTANTPDALVFRRCVRFVADALKLSNVQQLTDDERKEKEMTRFVVVIRKFGQMLGPAAWRDARFTGVGEGQPAPPLTIFGADAKSPGVLDCPAALMLMASSLAIIQGLLMSYKMRQEVFFVQAATSGDSTTEEKVFLGMQILLCSVLEELLRMPKDVLTRHGGEKVTTVLKELCFRTLLRQEVAYAESQSVDGMCRLLHHHTRNIADFLAYKFPQLLEALTHFTSALSFLKFFCPHLLIHFLAIAIFKVEMFMALFYLHTMLHRRRCNQHEDWPKDRSGETLSNFKAVRAYNRQAAAEKDFSAQLEFHANRGKRNFLCPFHASWMVLSFFFQYFDIYSKVYAGGLVVSGVISLAITQELLNKGGELVWRTWWALEQFGVVTPPWAHREESWIESGAKLLVLFEREPEITIEGGKWDASNCGEFRGDIELKGVTFRYPAKNGDEKPETIFENFDLKIKGGTKMGLVGPSGGGKTTALALIQRFYDVESGEVLLDGRPIKDYKPSFLANQISVVQQDAAIFDMTVSENIKWGKPDATEEEIEDALMKAALYHDLDRKPLRFETPAKELSGGQKQRLTIARAIVRKPKILLLDEATAALDTKSEREVQKALNALMVDVKGTCVAIAHRLSTIMDSDSIAVVKQKKVVEQGTHAELVLKEGGEYAELSRLAGMGGGDGEKAEEGALDELSKMIKAEMERDPGNTFIVNIEKKLKAAKAWTNAEQSHLKELKESYEKALQKHLDDQDAQALQATIERVTKQHSWTPAKGRAIANFDLMLPPLQLERNISATSQKAMNSLRRGQLGDEPGIEELASLPFLSLERAQTDPK